MTSNMFPIGTARTTFNEFLVFVQELTNKRTAFRKFILDYILLLKSVMIAYHLYI